MKNNKTTIWGIASVSVVLICVLFTFFLTPHPQPLDEQLTAFGRIADSDDLWQEGVLKHGAGDLDAALALYTQAIEVHPKSTMAYLYRGTLHYDRANYTQAIQEYTQALAIDPEFTWALNARGVAHYRNGDSDAAQQDFSKSHTLNPSFIGPAINQAVIQKLEGHLDQALMLLTQAEGFSSVSTPSPNVLENVGDIQFSQGNADEALNTYTTLLEYYPDHQQAYRARAMIHRALGNADKANEDELRYQQISSKEKS